MTQTHPHVSTARAAKLAAAEAMGIDPDYIDRLIEDFYEKVRGDPVLAPIFGARIADWPLHLGRMKQFWASILRGDTAFNGNPMARHVAIPAIEEFHFKRWLILFDATLQDFETDPAVTALVSKRAHAIADSLLTGIRIHRDGRRDLAAMKGMSHV